VSVAWTEDLKIFAYLTASVLIMTICYGPSLEAESCPLCCIPKILVWKLHHLLYTFVLTWLILDPAKWLWHFAGGSSFPCFGMVSASFQNTRSFLKLWFMTQTQVAYPSSGLWTAKVMKFMTFLFQRLTLVMKKMSLEKLKNCVLILSSICFWHNALNLWQFPEILSRQWCS